MSEAHRQGAWLAQQTDQEKSLFLAALAHELTIVARVTYVPQTEDLQHPRWLRWINEYQHRVAACQYQTLAGRGDPDFQASLAAWAFEDADGELRKLVAFAWDEAKRRVQG
jgi:hypothetical protein